MEKKFLPGDIVYSKSNKIYGFVETYNWITFCDNILEPSDWKFYYREPLIEKYEKEIERFLELKDIEWEKAQVVYEELENKCSALISELRDKYVEGVGNCLAYVGHVFLKLDAANKFWQKLKMDQEYEKFKTGDFTARLGGEYGRAYGIRKSTCNLCQQFGWCLFFDDNETYGKEDICENCMNIALTKIQVKKTDD